ncbi:DUF445 domain-containing protein [Staphylococcus caprae]|uniref:DUF445 domain-containing protein n=1 Tax=Staphylococcus caprae TaxID=29380 RepID=UPI001C84068F|nr:DUF445 family protein [Staphylococcus caprae]MBX5320205.1 DUF445 domain-containing protein [Staphylococcus caprae]
MHAFLIIVFMAIIGALIGGITNVIAIRMLFHPFKPYYIFKMRIPFTPGLIPKRRDEIANKIGQVIEDHLITEEMIREKLNQPQSRDAIHDLVFTQIHKLKGKDATIENFAQFFDINIHEVIDGKVSPAIEGQLNAFYYNHQHETIHHLLPKELIELADHKVEDIADLLCERAKVYLNSDKGAHDIYDMLDTFFQEKGKIVGLLQMFMTKESIAERIQHELIRLTQHPKARTIINQVIRNEYETLKNKTLIELIDKEQFENISKSTSELVLSYMNLNDKARMPLSELAPQLIRYLENEAATKITSVIVHNISQHLTKIMQKINLRQLIEDQINTFELDYIENLIIEIANKELKLIMSLGFILGGIIGLFQGVIAIFV